MSYLEYLEMLWNRLPNEERASIESVVNELNSKGTICSVYEFFPHP